jgi:hypothetical protein
MKLAGLSNGTRRTDRRAQRIAALQAELDIQGQRSVERTRTIETKAAYATTAAAAVVAASISILSPAWDDLTAILPLLLGATTIIVSTRAIVPLGLSVVSARDLVARYVDDDMPLVDLQDRLLEVRKVEIENRDTLNAGRAVWMTKGFQLLSASVVALLLSATISGIVQSEGDPGAPAGTPEPAESTISPSSPPPER